MRKYFLNKRGTNNKLWGPLSPGTGLARLRAAGSGHPSLFAGVKGQGFHYGTFKKAQFTNQHVFRPSRKQFIGGAKLDEDGGGVTA